MLVTFAMPSRLKGCLIEVILLRKPKKGLFTTFKILPDKPTSFRNDGHDCVHSYVRHRHFHLLINHDLRLGLDCYAFQ